MSARLIDFYFACNDAMAYDLAVTHAAWCFSGDGRDYRPEVGQALVEGYESVRPLEDTERAGAAIAGAGRGAAVHFQPRAGLDRNAGRCAGNEQGSDGFRAAGWNSIGAEGEGRSRVA